MKETVFNSDHTIDRVPKLRLGQSNWPFNGDHCWHWVKNKRNRSGRLIQISHRQGPGLEMQRTADWGWRVGTGPAVASLLLPAASIPTADGRAQAFLAQSVVQIGDHWLQYDSLCSNRAPRRPACAYLLT